MGGVAHSGSDTSTSIIKQENTPTALARGQSDGVMVAIKVPSSQVPLSTSLCQVENKSARTLRYICQNEEIDLFQYYLLNDIIGLDFIN